MAEPVSSEEASRQLLQGYRVNEEALLARLAQDLHDTIGQDLTVLCLSLDVSQLPGQTDKLRQDQVRLLVKNLVQRVRKLMYALMPPPTGDSGLDAAISSLVRGEDGPVTLEGHPETGRLAGDSALLAYRSIQHLLEAARRWQLESGRLSVTRHAGRVRIGLRAPGSLPEAQELRGLKALALLADGRLKTQLRKGGFKLELQLAAVEEGA